MQKVIKLIKNNFLLIKYKQCCGVCQNYSVFKKNFKQKLFTTCVCINIHDTWYIYAYILMYTYYLHVYFVNRVIMLTNSVKLLCFVDIKKLLAQWTTCILKSCFYIFKWNINLFVTAVNIFKTYYNSYLWLPPKLKDNRFKGLTTFT